jgi:hypothetical protein
VVADGADALADAVTVDVAVSVNEPDVRTVGTAASCTVCVFDGVVDEVGAVVGLPPGGSEEFPPPPPHAASETEAESRTKRTGRKFTSSPKMKRRSGNKARPLQQYSCDCTVRILSTV